MGEMTPFAPAKKTIDASRYFEAGSRRENGLAGKPPVCLYLEVTNRCNLLCTTCPRTYEELEPPADMSWELFASIVEQVAAYVDSALPSGACSIVRCAKRLGTTVRSLQWRLRDSGANFSDIVRAQRIELAKTQLRNSDASMHEIALLLGYSEEASFARAFKLWTGQTPRAFRQGERPGGVRRH